MYRRNVSYKPNYSFRKKMNRLFRRPRYYGKNATPSRLRLINGNKTFKLKGIFNMTASAGGVILNAVRMTEPNNYDGTATALTDWGSVANLYDQYRVTGIQIKFIPTAPQDASTATSYLPLYVFADFDSTTLTPLNAVAVGYDNMKVYNLYKPFTRFFRIPKLQTSVVGNTTILGYMDTVAPRATGAIYLSQAAGATANKLYGTVIVTYYIRCIVRK